VAVLEVECEGGGTEPAGNYQVKEEELDRTCSTHGTRGMHVGVFSGI
jgi:hypothetical protein